MMRPSLKNWSTSPKSVIPVNAKHKDESNSCEAHTVLISVIKPVLTYGSTI